MTDQLIVQGLPDTDEADLHEFIWRKRAGDALDSCIIIRDRETKRSRGFAFLQFYDAASARHFMETWHHGGLEMYGHPLRIDYSRDARKDTGSWICENGDCRASNYARREICFRCERPRAETDFTKDTGALPSQFLQLRGLPLGTTGQHIAAAVTRLQGILLRRVLLVHGREEEHVPIAFVEFEDSEAAARALALAAALAGKGFTVRGKPIALSFIHVGVFVPVYGDVGPGVFRATNLPQLLAYWNTSYQCEVYIPDGAIPEDEPAGADKHVTGNKRKRTTKVPVTKSSAAPGTGGGLISHWSRKQEELKIDEGGGDTSPPTLETRYADLSIMACLLCSRKFKTKEDLVQHETQSDLHRSNLADPDLVSKAKARVVARMQDSADGGVSATTTATTTPGAEYRDRALERRIQIKQSGDVVERPTAKHKKVKRDAVDADDQPQQQLPPGQKSQESKGQRLLNKMGYVSGGLGVSGQGRAEPVVAETYLPGVGLGSAGAKLDDTQAQSRREGAGSYAGFVASVKENARARYNRETSSS